MSEENAAAPPRNVYPAPMPDGTVKNFDPFPVYRAFFGALRAAGVEYDAARRLIALANEPPPDPPADADDAALAAARQARFAEQMDALEAVGLLAAAARTAFGVPTFDAGGWTDEEAYAQSVAFVAWAESLRGKRNPSPT